MFSVMSLVAQSAGTVRVLSDSLESRVIWGCVWSLLSSPYNHLIWSHIMEKCGYLVQLDQFTHFRWFLRWMNLWSTWGSRGERIFISEFFNLSYC